MVVNKRKKNSRQQGSHTHGWGAMKKHRGAGNRGGAGQSGSGKRADSKKPSIWKNKKYFGKHGFTSRKIKIKTINVGYLEKHLAAFVSKKLAKEEGDGFLINLNDLGVGKLLSSGKVTKKLTVTCKAASASAIKSIEAAKGKIILPKKRDSNGDKKHTS
ncbi:hypothetical protein CMO88_01715 [Candidatus Woesearchaeota archaeon]|nr:hypothetical protein [Candidatus Woesearchaeota archaeon]|tara:strand:+ start:20399 stop:20875 length:477 start_codon:yes stop_codon:yes gene_type:complete